MSNKKFRPDPKPLHMIPHVVAVAAGLILIRSVLVLIEQGIELIRPHVSKLESADGTVTTPTALMQVLVSVHRNLVTALEATGLMERVVGGQSPEQQEPDTAPEEKTPEADQEPLPAPKLVTD